MGTVRDFGVRGDGRTDDTANLQHAIRRCNGELIFPRGDYLITRTLAIPLSTVGRFRIRGEGGARVVMRGPGPAFHLIGTHRGTADPEDVTPATWDRERMPLIDDIEILGGHDNADGIRLERTIQATIRGVLIRRCRHGVHLVTRNRNVLIASCHIYENRGIGIYLDRVNLHQIVIEGNHISYCKQGGIRIEGSEIRNLQICSNDIEYNYDINADSSADVLLDCRNGTVREGTLVGNTIQARRSPNGANVRLLGAGRDNPNQVGLWAITGNLIGSQSTVVDLQSCRGVAVSGNSIYSGYERSLVIEHSDQVVIEGNSIDHNPEYRGASTDQVVVRNSCNVNICGLLLQHTLEAAVPAEASIEVQGCENINVTGCQLINARVRGVRIRRTRVARIADCTIRGRAADSTYRGPIEVGEGCERLMIVHNLLGRGSDGERGLPDGAGVFEGNVWL